MGMDPLGCLARMQVFYLAITEPAGYDYLGKIKYDYYENYNPVLLRVIIFTSYQMVLLIHAKCMWKPVQNRSYNFNLVLFGTLENYRI